MRPCRAPLTGLRPHSPCSCPGDLIGTPDAPHRPWSSRQDRRAHRQQKTKGAHLKDYQLVAPASEGFPEELPPSRQVPSLCFHSAPGQ